MKKLSLFFALAMFIASTAMAQQFQFAGFQDVETAFASQQAEMQQLRAQLASFQDMMADPEAAVAGGNAACCDSCCGSWYAGGEAVRLHDHASDGYNADDGEFGYRLWVGYQGCDNLGVVVRFFDYDNGDDPNYGNELQYIDLELTSELCVCNTEFVLSAGYRHANVKLQDNYANWNNLNGMTVGVQAQREICCNLSVFAWLHESFLFGTDDYDDYEQSHINWTEYQLGLQYDTCLAGRSAWLRAGVEAHDLAAPFDAYYYDAPGEFGYFFGGGVNY